MNTNLSSSTPTELETDCLVAVVLDRGEKDKPAPEVAISDATVRDAAKELIASGEVTGKKLRDDAPASSREPQGQTPAPSRGRKSQDILAPPISVSSRVPPSAHLKSRASAALLSSFRKPRCRPRMACARWSKAPSSATFEPGYYKSDRKNNDQKIEALTIVAQGDAKLLAERARQRARSSPNRRTSPATWSTNLPIE